MNTVPSTRATRGRHSGSESFRLAPMSPMIRNLSLLLLALPPGFLLGALIGTEALAIPAVFLTGIYLWVWLRFRPTRFDVHRDRLEVIWPLKRREILRADIRDTSIIDRQELMQEIGWGMRIGAGGLWGGFGLLWTRRRGMIRMYISRVDQFVWIEFGNGKPWLLTPERPEEFVRALGSAATAAP